MRVFEVGIPGVNPVWSVATAVLSNGEVCVVAASDGMDAATVRVWDGHTGQVVRPLSVPEDNDRDVALAVLPDLRVVVAATSGQETLVCDVESGAMLAKLSYEIKGFSKAPPAANSFGVELRALGALGAAPSRRGVGDDRANPVAAEVTMRRRLPSA